MGEVQGNKQKQRAGGFSLGIGEAFLKDYDT